MLHKLQVPICDNLVEISQEPVIKLTAVVIQLLGSPLQVLGVGHVLGERVVQLHAA